MKTTRMMTDSSGRSVLVEFEFQEQGAKFDAMLARLANKARKTASGRVTAADGAIVVSVFEIPEAP